MGSCRCKNSKAKPKHLWKINGMVQLRFILLQSAQHWSCGNGLLFQIIDVDLIILCKRGWCGSYLLCLCRPIALGVPLKRKALWISVPGFHQAFCYPYCDCYSQYFPCGVNQGELVFRCQKASAVTVWCFLVATVNIDILVNNNWCNILNAMGLFHWI